MSPHFTVDALHPLLALSTCGEHFTEIRQFKSLSSDSELTFFRFLFFFEGADVFPCAALAGCLTFLSTDLVFLLAGSVFFSGVRIRLGMIFNYLILWVRVKGQG